MENTKTIIIGCDHAGFLIKEFIKKELVILGYTVEDVGTHSQESVDYPVYSAMVAQAVATGKYKQGIVVCGSGVGASICANRFKKVRAALCITPEMAQLSRKHNDANVLAIGERITPEDTVREILKVWLTTEFEGGRHARRVEQIDKIVE